MRVQVKAMRQKGRNLPGDQLKSMPPKAGELLVEQKRDAELSRNTLRARLIDDKSGNDILPELSSAELVLTKKNVMRLAGLERIDQVDYAQTWSIEVV
jgi:hypothetical protein